MEGRTLANRYVIKGFLGEGGMGSVYEAEHLQLGKRVALKRLHAELADDANAVRRFQREARAAGSIGHQHIVRVLDVGFGEDGAPYLAMELLEGETLAQRLRRGGRLDPRRAARMAGEILSALQSVHSRGVIHRDLKPDNIFLAHVDGRRDFVKVLDFGISKIRETGVVNEALTKTGVMMGTPHYMSKEQAQGRKDLDHRVDIYAVGVLLYEALSGQLPHSASNYHALLQEILAGDPERLATLVPSLPKAFGDAVHRAMASDRDERFRDAHTMHAALRPFGAVALSEPGTMRPPPVVRGDGPTERMDSDARADRFAAVGWTGRSDRTERSASPPGMPPFVPRASRPVPFVAQSPDFSDPLEPIRPQRRFFSTPPVSGVSERVDPLEVSPTSPAWAPSWRPPASGELDHAMTVKASFLLAVSAGLDELRGAGTARSLIDSEPRLRRHWPADVLPIARVPFEVVEHFLERLDAMGMGRAEDVHALGIRAGGSDRMGTHKRLLDGATAETLLRRLGTFYGAYFSAGRLVAERRGPGDWVLRLEELTASGSFLTLLAGFFQQVFERNGHGEAVSEVVGARAEGHARDAIALRWRV